MHTDPAPAEAGISVESLLDETLFHETLIGGGSGVSKTVTWCVPLDGSAGAGPALTAEDLADSAVFVRAEDLAQDAHPDLVGRLAELGASLILAWTRPGQAAPDLAAAARAADAASIPLLLLPPRTTFREASRLIGVKVLAQTTHVLEYGTRVHRALAEVFARGAGLQALARSMSHLSGATVLILGNNGELLADASPTASSIEESEQLIGLVNARQYTVERGDDQSLSQVAVLDMDGDAVHAVLAPIRVAGDPYGLLILLEPSYPAPEHDLSQHAVIAEEGVSLAGSELLRQHSVREAEERARNDFVQALLHGRFTDNLELVARAAHYKFPVEGRFAVFVMTGGDLHPDDDTGRRRMNAAERVARSLGSEQGVPSLTAVIGSMVVVVRQVVAGSGPAAASDPLSEPHQLGAFATQLQRTASQRLRTEVRVAYGRPFDGASGVAKSYREARMTEALARRVHASEVCSYADLRVFAALQESAMSEAGRAFATEVMAPLKQLDGQTGNLEQLVLAYIEEAGNLNATARRLHLHRNTMLYKLERASRAMQMDIRSPESQFMIWLAHHLTALGDTAAGLDAELTPPT